MTYSGVVDAKRVYRMVIAILIDHSGNDTKLAGLYHLELHLLIAGEVSPYARVISSAADVSSSDSKSGAWLGLPRVYNDAATDEACRLRLAPLAAYSSERFWRWHPCSLVP